MTCKERMDAVLLGQPVDRYPFVPSIYEHGANVIGHPPGDVCLSVDLMAEAALKSWEAYEHDLVTVGVDIYNIEAEAFGCPVAVGVENGIPGITGHPLEEQETLDVSALTVPAPAPSNRLQLIVDASRRVADELADKVWVYGCMGGPFSQAVELRGFENLIVDTMLAPERVHALLEKTTELCLQQAARFGEVGCSVNIFESWATLPLIPPDIFGAYVVPYNKRVIAMVKERFDVPPPAVIMGGNTALLMDHFIECGTSLVVADYNADFDFMRRKTEDNGMIVRGCVDPKQIERGDWDGVREAAGKLAAKAQGMRNFVWGCGAVSYGTTTEHLLTFKEICVSLG